MPVGKFTNQEFLDQNASRRYPLADDATGLDVTGSFTIPDDLILELDLPIAAGVAVDPGRFFVSQIISYPSGFLLTIAYQPVDGAAITVASATGARSGHTRATVYALGGVEPFHDSVGKVVIGKFDNIDRQPAGLFQFTLDTARLDPDAIRPIIRGVTGLIAVNNGEESEPVYDYVRLNAGSNFRITVSGHDIYFHAISGEGLTEDCACDDAEPVTPLTNINGVYGTAAGDFYLIGNECIAFESVTNGLKVTDVCAKPCCGFSELERITDALDRIRVEAATVDSYVAQLRISVDTMESIVLGARLGDRPCAAG